MRFVEIVNGLEDRGYLGDCAKKKTWCRIIAADGEEFYAENWCASPQNNCPRKKGEGYAKCKTICHQLGHAEENALRLALDADKARGATAVFGGHSYACRDCQEQLYGCGIIFIGRDPNYTEAA